MSPPRRQCILRAAQVPRRMRGKPKLDGALRTYIRLQAFDLSPSSGHACSVITAPKFQESPHRSACPGHCALDRIRLREHPCVARRRDLVPSIFASAMSSAEQYVVTTDHDEHIQATFSTLTLLSALLLTSIDDRCVLVPANGGLDPATGLADK